MPLLRFVILKQSTDQRVGVSFVAEDEDELEYGAQPPARTALRSPDAEPGPEPDVAPHD